MPYAVSTIRRLPDMRSKAKAGKMLGTLVTVAIVAAIVAVVVGALPDIKRYMKIRKM